MPQVVVTVESRYVRTPDRSVWTLEGPAYSFFTRYHCTFDRVRVVARVADTAQAPQGAHRVDGPGVEVWPVPYYHGPRQYLRQRPAVARAVQEAVGVRDAVILRVPSVIGAILAASRYRRRQPFALEVMADPDQVFAPGVIHHPLRPLLRWWSVRALQRQCRTAIGVAYVTDRYLQERYPSGPDAVTASYPCVELPPEAFVSCGRPVTRSRQAPATLVSVGTLEQMYKGIDTLVTAVARLATVESGPRLVHIGGGRHRPALERLAVALGVSDLVVFPGALPAGPAVRERLDAASLFVLPSRTEGLPKALVEAMARGLPAIASAVGGVPELLPPEYLVPPDDAPALATKVDRLLASPEEMAATSARNLARARDFSAERLAAVREDFYREVRDGSVGGLAVR